MATEYNLEVVKMEDGQDIEGMGQQFNPDPPPHQVEGNFSDTYNNDQLGSEIVGELTANQRYNVLQDVYLQVVLERDTLRQQIQQRDSLIQATQQQRDASILEAYQLDTFNQKIQQQCNALIEGINERDELITKFQERELKSNRQSSDQVNKIKSLEDQIQFQNEVAFKTWVEHEKFKRNEQAKNDSMKKELDENQEKCKDLERQLEQYRARDNVQEGIMNSTLPELQVDTSVPSTTLMDEGDDAAADENEVSSPHASSIGSKLSSLSESKSAELNDFEPMLHFVDVYTSSRAGTFVCVCGKKFPTRDDRYLHLEEMRVLAASKQAKLSATAGKSGMEGANPTIQPMAC